MFYNEVQIDCFYFECVYCLSDLFAWKKSTKSSLETGKTFATLLANIETRQLLIEVETEEQFKVWCHNFSTFSKVCCLISVWIMVWKLLRMWKLVRQNETRIFQGRIGRNCKNFVNKIICLDKTHILYFCDYSQA